MKRNGNTGEKTARLRGALTMDLAVKSAAGSSVAPEKAAGAIAAEGAEAYAADWSPWGVAALIDLCLVLHVWFVFHLLIFFLSFFRGGHNLK